MHGIGQMIHSQNPSASIIFGGDFNPLPYVAVDTQLGPVLDPRCGAQLATPLIPGSSSTPAEFVTWELKQPLTRCCAEDTPHDMQLDFLLFRPPKTVGTMGVRHHERSEVVDREAFFVHGAPLSDHYGLKASWKLTA